MEAVFIAAMAISLIALVPIYIFIWSTIGKSVADQYFSELLFAATIGFIFGLVYFFILAFCAVIFLESVVLPKDINLYFKLEEALDGRIFQGMILGVCCAIGGATAMKLK